MRRHFLPFNLQFFAEGDGGEAGAEGGEGTQEGGTDGGAKDEGGSAGQGQKTFTQEEVNRMMTREKREGKKSVLSSLGFKTEDEAKNAMKLLNALMDSQKTPEDKANDKVKGAESEKEAAERRAEAAENKLACVMAGVAKDAVDDVLAIALLKVSDDKPLDKVLADMKKEKRYSSFFGQEHGSGEGTGNEPGHGSGSGKGGSKPGDFGRMVADSALGSAPKKSSFFKEG